KLCAATLLFICLFLISPLPDASGTWSGSVDGRSTSVSGGGLTSSDGPNNWVLCTTDGRCATAEHRRKHEMRRLRLILVVACYVAAFLWAYATVLSQSFAYEGFKLSWPDPATMGCLLVLALLPGLLLPHTLSRPSALILWWLYLAAYIPSILIPPLSLTMPIEKLLPLQVYLLLCMGLLCLVPSARLLAIGHIKLSQPMFWSVFVIVWLAVLAFVCVHGPSSMMMANFASFFVSGDVYAMRSYYFDHLFQVGKSLGYAMGQLGQALNPYLMAFGIVNRRKTCLIAGILGQIIVFGLTGFKSILFSIIFLGTLFIFMKRWRQSFGLMLAAGLTAAILLSAAVDAYNHNIFLSSLITRRTLATPGLLTGFYFEHFSQVAHAGMGFHFSRWPPAFFGPPQEIGLVYFGRNVDANANIWAEGFAEFGVMGIFGMTALTGLLIWAYDSISAKRNLEMAALLAAMPALNLSNTAPTTVL